MPKEQDKVFQALQAFVDAWEQGNVELLDHCTSEEMIAYFSIFGTTYTREEMKAHLRGGRQNDVEVRMWLENHICSVEENHARQYATLVGCFAGSGKNLGMQLIVAGSFVNTLIKDGDSWKLELIRFELQTDNVFCKEYLTDAGVLVRCNGKGTYKLVPGWKEVNDRVGYFMDALPEQGKHVIVGESDAPWYALEAGKTTENEEDAIRELFLKYCFALDFNTFSLMNDIFADDSLFLSEQAGVLNKHDAIAYLKLVRQGMPRSFHAGKFAGLELNGEYASCEVERLLVETSEVCLDETGTLKIVPTVGRYAFRAKKADAVWKICSIQYFEI